MTIHDANPFSSFCFHMFHGTSTSMFTEICKNISIRNLSLIGALHEIDTMSVVSTNYRKIIAKLISATTRYFTKQVLKRQQQLYRQFNCKSMVKFHVVKSKIAQNLTLVYLYRHIVLRDIDDVTRLRPFLVILLSFYPGLPPPYSLKYAKIHQ